MRKHLFFGLALSTLMGVSATVFAQEPVVMLHHNGEQTPFAGIDGLKNAYEAAVDNDTIYLSGGLFNQPTDYAKSLYIYGTGINSDSTKATNITILNNVTSLRKGANNFHLEGVQCNNTIRFGYENDTISNIQIIACMYKGISAPYYPTNCLINNLLVAQCIFTGGLDLNKTHYAMLENNIVIGVISNNNNNLIENNIIMSSANYYYTLLSGTNNTFNNNICIRTSSAYLVTSGNTFNNNINCEGSTENDFNSNPYTVDNKEIFVNWNEKAEFSWEQDFHLQNPETYLGIDGTQVGIYGGKYAWPEAKAVLPSNPHIRAFDAASNTDENGMLQINVKVGAQN